jgi:two-component system CheB/CheR fusion protein
MVLNGWKIIQDGDAQQMLLSIEDISDRKQFEAERSQLLAQEQSARQQAEAANRAKDEFLSNLSHELRNPLSIILSWAQLLRDRPLDDIMARRALNTIERSARAQAQLIEDLLDVSRITSGKLTLTRRLLDLISVIEGAIESVQLAAEAKAIQISSQLNAATIMGDRDRLQQVLWNLLTNAIKFTPSGGRVEVTLESIQGHAEVCIQDTGQGIRAELLPYIFDRFRQGDSSTTKGKQGLGLGLSIVRHIVELHGGTVRAESAGEGQGASLLVRLPLRSPTSPEFLAIPPELNLSLDSQTTRLELPLPDNAEPSCEEREAAVQLPSLAGLHILVVDDEVNNLEVMKYTLEMAGADVSMATSVREAIALFTQSTSRYDVLLADIGMPGEDGLALIRQVRAMDAIAGGQIPAMAISGYVSEPERQQALDAGFQQHLAKPFEPVQLIQQVANLVGDIRHE